MAFTPGNTLGQGRPKGSQNKEISKLREALTAITVGGLEDFVTTLAELRETNPVKYQETYIKLLEYSLPKLRSVDTNISMDAESLGSIKIEVITKEKNEGTKHTSDGSIPEELPSN
jgi:hypothetical protein